MISLLMKTEYAPQVKSVMLIVCVVLGFVVCQFNTFIWHDTSSTLKKV